MRKSYRKTNPGSIHLWELGRLIKRPFVFVCVYEGLFGDEIDPLEDEREGRYLQFFRRAHECGRNAVDIMHKDWGLNVYEILKQYEEEKICPIYFDEEWDLSYPSWYQDEFDRIHDEFLNGVYERIFELKITNY